MLCSRGNRRDDASALPSRCGPKAKHVRLRTLAHSLLVIGSSSRPSRITSPRETGASARRQPPTPRFLPCGSLSDSLRPPRFQGFKQPIPSILCSPHQPHPPNATTTTARASNEKQRGLERGMLLMASAEHQKRRRGRPLSADLLQNCDLPPPAKLFGPFPTLQRLDSAAGTDQKGDGNDSLLRALRLSQSRAREAEQKLAAAGASNGGLAALLVRDSVALSAHRRWVMMLEAENSVLRAAGGRRRPAGADPGEDDYGAGSARHGVAAAWWVALAVCVGLALGNLLL